MKFKLIVADKYQRLITELCEYYEVKRTQIFTSKKRGTKSVTSVRKVLCYYLQSTHDIKQLIEVFQLDRTTILYYLRDAVKLLSKDEHARMIFYRSQETHQVIPELHMKYDGPIAKRNLRPVNRLRNGKVNKKYQSVADAARAMGMTRSSRISNAIKNNWKCGGYDWEYA